MYLTVLFDNKDSLPIKIFPHFGKAGGCSQLFVSAICDILSGELERKTDTIPILSRLVGQSCHQHRNSCVDILSRFMLDMITKKKEVKNEEG